MLEAYCVNDGLVAEACFGGVQKDLKLFCAISLLFGGMICIEKES